MPELAIFTAVKNLFGLITGNKYVAIGLTVVILIGVSIFYFHHEVKKDVKAQVVQHDAIASAVATGAAAKATAANAIIDQTYDAKAKVIKKEYDNVRTTVTDPVAAKGAVASEAAPLDPVLLDALNQLAVLHSGAGSDSTDQSPD